MIDAHGNEFIRMDGRSRIVTHEQFLAILFRPHEERGCCCDQFGHDHSEEQCVTSE